MSAEDYEVSLNANTWDPSRDAPLSIKTELSPALWLEPRLAAGTYEVRVSAPQGFEAYARIFFPFVISSVGVGGEATRGYVTWRELARRNGRVAHALMERDQCRHAWRSRVVYSDGLRHRRPVGRAHDRRADLDRPSH